MYKQSVTLFFLKFLKVPLSIFTLSLTARFFGVTVENDIWLLASTIITVIGLAIWGPINETFRAKFVAIKETENEKKAISLTQSLIIYMVLISSISILILVIFPQSIGIFIASKFSNNDLNNLYYMISCLAPIILLSQLSSIFSSILNAYEIYYIPEISSLITQIINIFIIIFLAPIIGIESLVVAIYISTITLNIFLIFKILKIKIPIIVDYNFSFRGFKIFFTFSIPFFIPYFIGQINTLVEKSIAASLGIGSVSILELARRIPDTLNNILISVVLSILVPILTKSFIRNDNLEYEEKFLTSYRLGMLGLISFFIFFVNGADSLYNILYSNQQISHEKMELIILISKYFSFSLIGVFSYIIFGMSMLSSNKAKLYVISGSIAQILLIFFNILLVSILGLKTFPISYFFAHFLAAIFMYINYPFDKLIILKNTLHYYLFGVVNIISVIYIFPYLKSSSNNPFIDLFFALILTVFVVIILGFFFRIKEVMLLIERLRFRSDN